MAQKRKRRTSIRTAAGLVQEKFIARMAELAADPLRVLPECPDGDPKAIAKIRSSLTKFAAGKKPSFFDKRDKGIVGAVAHSMPLADLEAVPRILDTKVAGKRRFFLQRGHVARACMLGVQNHDEPRALLMAYRDMAKSDNLHFFAGQRLYCTGDKPLPPTAWIELLASDVGTTATPMEGGWRFGNEGAGHVRLQFRGGPFIDIEPRATKGHHVHQAMAARYAGPRQRHPVEVHVVLPDGKIVTPERDPLASYRAGVIDDRRLADDIVAAWRQETRSHGGRRYVLGDVDFGEDQSAFIEALAPEPWEADVLVAVTQDGFVGRAKTAADVFQARRESLPDALRPWLDDDAAAFTAQHQNSSARDIVRLALDEAAARKRAATLPPIQGGTETTIIDGIARAHKREGTSGARSAIKAALDGGKVSPGHLAAFAQAIQDTTLSARWSADDKATGADLKGAAEYVLDTQGEAYVEAVVSFLEAAGSGERPHALD